MDVLDDVFKGILSGFQPPHELNELGVDHASSCSALRLVIVMSISPHPHVSDCVRVTHWDLPKNYKLRSVLDA